MQQTLSVTFFIYLFAELACVFIVCLATPNVITATYTTVRPSTTSHTPVPEPGPDWPVAKLQWGLAWKLHWIGLGLAYAFLACRSLWALILSPNTTGFARKHLYNAINWLLLALGITRSLFLWIDPYESGENIVRCPLWIIRPLFGIAFPCLMSAFCLVHIAFLEVAKVQIGPPKLRRLRFVVSIILVHFAVVIVSDTTTALKADRTELLVVCQSFFIVWGLLNSINFIYSGSKVVIKARNIRNKICERENINENQSKPNSRRASVKIYSLENKEKAKYNINRPYNIKNREDVRDKCTIQQVQFGSNLTVESAIRKASKRHRIKKSVPTRQERAIHKVAGITLVTSVLSISCCALQIYSLFGVYSIYSKAVSPKPWPWLAFQTSFRLVELFMAYALSYCVLRSGGIGKRGIFSWLLSLKSLTRKRRGPRITVVQVQDIRQRDLPERGRYEARLWTRHKFEHF